MPDERWKRVWSLFHEASAKPHEERDAFLQQACAGDGSLLEDVASLLPFNDSRGDMLEKPPILEPEDGETAWMGTLAGQKIGPYFILKEIGAGGMGVVYEADQEEPIHRRVALKVIKPGMDTREVLARFLAERQTLAVMSHPGIATVFDGGVTDQGRPYFVMERVEGIPITEYCDMERATVRERLELFMDVCSAVQHAHQKGIIHRDIKPSNVLVTVVNGKPAPKIIDFGVAKALGEPFQDVSRRTQPGRILGTPEFMSPEQATMAGDIDTRTDIYSLGVLLYRLLTGLPPYPTDILERGYAAVRDAIIERDLCAPSVRLQQAEDREAFAAARRTDAAGLARQLRRELDWILGKALEKERNRRYQTVSSFVEDIESFLNLQPVAAGPPTAIYRTRRFVRRHRLGVAAAAISGVAVFAIALVMAIQSGQIRRALVEARTERERAEQTSNFLVELFRRSDPFAGKNATVREVLDEGAAKIERDLSGQPELQAALMETMGVAYRNLAVYDQAARLLEQSLELRRRLGGDETLDAASSIHNLGVSYQFAGKLDEAESRLRQSLSTRRKLLGDHSLVVASLTSLGALLREKGDFAGSEQALREALASQRALAQPDDVREAGILDQLANVLYRKGDYSEAEKTYDTSLALRRRRPEVDLGTAGTLGSFGAFLIDRGKYEAAEPLLREALEWFRKNLGNGHPRAIMAMNNLALLHQQRGDIEVAESLYRQIVELTPPQDLAQSATNLNNLALVLQEKESYGEAEEVIRRALALQRRAWGDRHPNVGFGLNNLARVLHDQGKLTQAEKHYREALDLRRATLQPGHPNLAPTIAGLGKLLTDRGKPAEAEKLLREALDIRRRTLGQGDWRISECQSFLGESLAALGRYDEAEPLLVEGYRGLAKRGEQYRGTRDALSRLIRFYDRTKQPDKAASYRKPGAPASAGQSQD